MGAIKLPEMEHKFAFEEKGEETQKWWRGNFTYKRLTLGERALVDKEKAKLMEGLFFLPEEVIFYYDMIALLKYGLKEYEDWWEESNFGKNFHDLNVIAALYKECMTFEQKWSEALEKNIEAKGEEKKETVKSND